MIIIYRKKFHMKNFKKVPTFIWNNTYLIAITEPYKVGQWFFFFFKNWDNWFDPLFGQPQKLKLKLILFNYWLGQFFEMRWKTHHTSVLAKGMICKISDFGLTRDVYVDDTYWKKSNGRSKCVHYFNLGSLWKIIISFQIHTYNFSI